MYVADLATSLVDATDQDQNITQAGGTVTDTVTYTNLIPNTVYTLSGELHDQATGDATGITATDTFTTSASGSGTTTLDFTINDQWAGYTLVAFETVSLGGTTIAVHEDIDDEAQTVWIADIRTTLLDEVDEDSNLVQAGGTVIDTVEYTNLLPNTEYVMSGELVDQATGTPTGITGSTAFTSSDTGNGFVEVEFVINDDWAGYTLVAFEVLSQNGTEIAVHEDIDDEAQTVYIADIRTTLLDEVDEDSNLVQAGGTVIDTVEYTNLLPNTAYVMSGELVDQATGTPTGITGSTPFTSSASGNGFVEVVFTISGAWAGYSLVAFEVLSQNGIEIAVHEDINDEAQTVHIADIRTTLLDEVDEDSNLVQSGGTVIDTVEYTNLLPNTEYVMSGELMDQATGTPTGITGSTAFTSSDTGDGFVEVEFVISGEWAGYTLVAFEVLSQNGTEIAVHEDINDEAQTVHIADIRTTLLDEVDEDSNLVQAGGTVIDTVEYTNLLPNTEYVMSGELMDQATGTGTGILGSTAFTSSDTGDGFVEVEFVISGEWAGYTLVAFEVLSQNGTEIAVHEDIDDEAQTVWIADIGTTLVDAADGDKNIAATGGTVIDTIAYVNLLPNTEYTLTGELIDKDSGEATGITGTTTFTSSATGSGTAEVEFVITEEWAGHTLVAFEVLTLADLEIAVHEDINDEAQTVVVDEPDTPTTPSTTDVSPTSQTTSTTDVTPTSASPSSSSDVIPTSDSNPTTPTKGGNLPSTGVSSTTGTLALLALLALALGVGLALWGRTRSTRQH